MSPTSTSGGCSIAKATAREIASGGIAILLVQAQLACVAKEGVGPTGWLGCRRSTT
jgi:hypothetical protein